jgi:cell wall-associated NlpC family hydrolase
VITIADRTVSARLRADVSGFIAGMRAATGATRQFRQEVERAGRGGFESSEQAAARLERTLARLLETERRNRAEQQRQSQQRRRVGDETRRHSDEVDRNTGSQERNTRAAQQATRGLTAQRSTLVSLMAGAAGVTAELAAAGAAAAAFGVLAAPSIARVVSAQQDLAASWSSLSDNQRVSALLVRGLTGEYEDLAASFQPQALQAFNTVMGTSRAILPQVGTLATATAGDVNALLRQFGQFAEDRVGGEFLTWAGRRAPEALDVLGTTMTTAGDTALDLVQDTAPLGISFLQLANGVLSGVNAVAGFNPMLAQLGLSALLLRAPVAGIVSGIGNMNTRMQAAAAASVGMTRGQRALNLVGAAGPALWTAAGIAVGFFAIKALTAKDGTDRFVESLRRAREAAINNSAVIEQQVNLLNLRYNAAIRETRTGMEQTGDSSSYMSSEAKKLGAAAREAQAELNRLDSGSRQLGMNLGLTQGEAKRLATAAGVDLTKSLDDAGILTFAATNKIRAYQQAVMAANNPTIVISSSLAILSDRTSTLEQRTKAVASAYNAQLGPALAAFNANVQLKQGYQDLSRQLAATKAGMDGNSGSSLRLQQQLSSQVDTTWKLWAAERERTGSTQAGTAAVRQQLPVLYALAGQNTSLRNIVDSLARSTGNNTGRQNISRTAFLNVAASMGIARGQAERLWREYGKVPAQTRAAADGVQHFSERTRRALHAMTDKELDVTVRAKGRFIPGVNFNPSTTAGRATGGPIPASWALGPGGPTSDDVPLWASVGEHMWTAAEVAAVGGHAAMERLRAAAMAGQLRGYAVGGAVTFRGHPPTERARRAMTWTGEYSHLQWLQRRAANEQAEVLADAYRRFWASGGPVVAAARSQLGVPYVWGGTAWGRGLDCSGLTQGAWRRGAGVDITRTTYTQYPNSAHLGAPRPGALGFPHMGHVVLYSGAGRIIEAPFTGARVREVGIGRHYEWRWPKAARFAGGGEVRALGRDFVGGGASPAEIALAKLMAVAGDPGLGGIPGYEGGGWVRGVPGRDQVLVRASAGEFMVNRNQAARYGALLEAVNGGRLAPIAPAAPAQTGAARQVHLHLDRVIVRDAVDVDMLMQRVEFRLRAAEL